MAKHNILEYKGYHTEVEFDSDDFLLRGKIEGITDYVDFECDNLKDLEHEFHAAVDDYLVFCEEVGKNPEKEYKGTFNVRIAPELHKKLALEAKKEGCSLNSTVEKAICVYISRNYEAESNWENMVTLLANSLKNESIYSPEHSVTHQQNIIPFKNSKVQFN